MAKRMSSLFLLMIGALLLSPPGFGAVPGSSKHWVGGQWTPPLSLLSIRSQYSQKKKLGRIQLELGLKSGFPLCCQPGFYHVEMDSRLQRAVITLKKLAHAKFGESYYKNVLEKSRLIDRAQVIVDPLDKDMVIALYLKKGVEVRTKERTTKDRRTFLDIYLRKPK